MDLDWNSYIAFETHSEERKSKGTSKISMRQKKCPDPEKMLIECNYLNILIEGRVWYPIFAAVYQFIGLIVYYLKKSSLS